VSPVEYWCRWQILLAALEWKWIYGHMDARICRVCSHFSGQASSRARCEVAICFNIFHRPAL
jgi:hypothetical protein